MQINASYEKRVLWEKATFFTSTRSLTMSSIDHTYLDRRHARGLLGRHQLLNALVHGAEPDLAQLDAAGRGRLREVHAAAAAEELRLSVAVGHHLTGQRVVRHQRLGQCFLESGRGGRRVEVAEEEADVERRQEEVQVGQRQAVFLHRQRRRHRDGHGAAIVVLFGGF